MTLRKFTLATLLFTACGDPKTPKSSSVSFEKNNSILIVNGNGENFTLIDKINSERTVHKNISMSLNPNIDAHPCKAPNQMLQHQNKIYVTCSLSHEIQVFDAETLELVHIVPLGAAHNPMSMLFIDENTVLTSGFITNKILAVNTKLFLDNDFHIQNIIDLNSLTLHSDNNEKTYARPSHFAKIGNTGFVALSNLKSDAQLGMTAGGPGYVLAFDLKNSSKQNLIQAKGRNTVAVYAGLTEKTKNYIYIVNAGDYNRWYIGNGSIDIYDTEKNIFITSLQTGGAPMSLEFSSDHKMYINDASSQRILSFDAETFERYKDIDLTGQHCGSNPIYSYFNSLLVKDDLLFITEYNTNCLLILNRKTGNVESKLETGSGPQTILAL